jgi:hypothetical protein
MAAYSSARPAVLNESAGRTGQSAVPTEFIAQKTVLT